MKQAFINKVNDYKAAKVPISRKTTFEANVSNINPREFVLWDNKSLAEVDNDFMEKDKPIFDDEEFSRKESYDVQSFTELKQFDREEESAGDIEDFEWQASQINPNQIKINDGDISKYDENDFDENSQSNVARGINKDKQKQK